MNKTLNFLVRLVSKRHCLLCGEGGGGQENAVKTVFRTTPAPKGVSVTIRMYEHRALENRLHCVSAVPR